MSNSDDDSAALACSNCVPGCGGGDFELGEGPPQRVCLSCVHEHFASAPSAIPHLVEELLSGGHTLVDSEGETMSAAGARDAARAYFSTCGSEMDPTGGRCWDCSRLLAAALSGTRLSWTDIGLNRPPEVVMELGAGTGDLAIELSDSGSRFSHGLALYLATDVQGRAEQIRQRVAGLGTAERERLRVAPLRWGQPVQWGGSGGLLPRAPDLVLACELLYYSAENCMEDRLIPLADTLASACRERGTVALVAFRERSAELEAAFFGACRDRGLAAEPCAPELLLECGGPAGAARRDPHGGAVRLIKLVKTL